MMAVCARAIDQNGVLLLALDPTATDLTTCPYVVEDGSSTAWRELGNLSIENAADISVVIAGLWTVAFIFKTLRRTLAVGDEKE